VSTPTPRTWADPPSLDPYLYGLLSVANVTTGEGTWQVGGIEYDTDNCAEGGYVLGSCPVALPGADLTATVTFDPVAGGVTVTSDTGNDFTVLWAITPDSGGDVVTGSTAPTAAPLTVPLPNGGYTVHAQAYGGVVVDGSGALTVPGGATVTTVVTVTATGPGTTHDKPLAEGLNHVESPGPFTIYARSECNAVGFTDPQDTARARVALIENREVEHAFSRLVLGSVGSRFPLGVTAVGIKQALGALEADAALHYGGAPVLHSPRWTNPYFEDRRLLQPNKDTGPVRRTHLTSRVAFGGGYYDNPFDPATAPDTGTFWLLATGTVRAWRSEVFVNETFTTATNLRAAIAERTYLLDADCYRAAVLVDLTGED
jgi:hypothetical protein